MRKAAANTGFSSGGVTCELGAYASIQIQCQLTVLCFETRHTQSPEPLPTRLRDNNKIKIK